MGVKTVSKLNVINSKGCTSYFVYFGDFPMGSAFYMTENDGKVLCMTNEMKNPKWISYFRENVFVHEKTDLLSTDFSRRTELGISSVIKDMGWESYDSIMLEPIGRNKWLMSPINSTRRESFDINHKLTAGLIKIRSYAQIYVPWENCKGQFFSIHIDTVSAASYVEFTKISEELWKSLPPMPNGAKSVRITNEYATFRLAKPQNSWFNLPIRVWERPWSLTDGQVLKYVMMNENTVRFYLNDVYGLNDCRLDPSKPINVIHYEREEN